MLRRAVGTAATTAHPWNTNWWWHEQELSDTCASTLIAYKQETHDGPQDCRVKWVNVWMSECVLHSYNVTMFWDLKWFSDNLAVYFKIAHGVCCHLLNLLTFRVSVCRENQYGVSSLELPHGEAIRHYRWICSRTTSSQILLLLPYSLGNVLR